MGRVDLVARSQGEFLRLFAMKRLLPHMLDDDAAQRAFMEEARVAAQLRHANVVSVIDLGEDHEGAYLVMEFVPGVALSHHLRTVGRDDELLAVDVVLEIARQAAVALEAAHAEGVVHRDVTPSNLLLGFDGVVRLSDFGIARAQDADRQTTTHMIKGKLGYLSPEQLRFERANERTDIYSLGVCLYEALASERLYQGEPAEVARRITHEPPPEIGDLRQDVPIELSALLLDMMAKDMEVRPRSATEVRQRLTALAASLGSFPVHELAAHLRARHPEEYDEQRSLRDQAQAVVRQAAVAEAAAARPRRWRWRQWSPWVGIALVALASAALGAWSMARDDRVPPQATSFERPASPRRTGPGPASAATEPSPPQPAKAASTAAPSTMTTSTAAPSTAAPSTAAPSTMTTSVAAESVTEPSAANSAGASEPSTVMRATSAARRARHRASRRGRASPAREPAMTAQDMRVNTWSWDE